MSEPALSHAARRVAVAARATVAATVVVLAMCLAGGTATASMPASPAQSSTGPEPVSVAEPFHPTVPADSAGYPTIPCGPANDGEFVSTYDADGGLGYYKCGFEDDIMGTGAGGFVWTEYTLS